MKHVKCLRTSDVAISGYLSRRHRANNKYLLELYNDYKDFMIDPYRLRGKMSKEKSWDGEYAGKWLDSAVKMAVNTGDADLTDKVDSFAGILRSMQESDGYMGIEGQELKGKSMWDIWNQWYALTGWITHYEQSDDENSLDSASRTAKWVVSNYGVVKDRDAEFFKCAHNGGCNVDIIGQIARLYKHSRNEELLDFVHAILKHYPPIKEMRKSGRVLIETPYNFRDEAGKYPSYDNPKDDYMMHPYVLYAYLGGIVEYAHITGQNDEMGWVESVWKDVVDKQLYPTGGSGFRERFREDAPNDDPDGEHQETCATVEWITLNQSLYCATGKARYMHTIENAVYNGLLGAQSVDGMKWMYYTPLRYHKRWFSGSTRCCYWSGPRGIAILPELVYACDETGLFVNLFEQSKALLTIKDTNVTVEQMTDYPATGNISIKLNMDSQTVFELRIRIPSWVEELSLNINKKSANCDYVPGEYLVLNRRWCNEDTISIEFEIPTVLKPVGYYGIVVMRGAEVMSMDSRDNEKFLMDTIEMDNVRIPDDIHLTPKGLIDGRRIYAGRISSDGNYRDMIFTPYADAGNYLSCFKTIIPSKAEVCRKN